MARPSRREFAEALYPVTARGNERCDIFIGNPDASLYTDRTSFSGFVGLQSDTAGSFGTRKPKTRVQRV